jgi:hypothetical protein
VSHGWSLLIHKEAPFYLPVYGETERGLSPFTGRGWEVSFSRISHPEVLKIPSKEGGEDPPKEGGKTLEEKRVFDRK